MKPTFVIENLTKEDEGEYKCRVDYPQARSHEYSANLTIIGEYSPPNSIKLPF